MTDLEDREKEWFAAVLQAEAYWNNLTRTAANLDSTDAILADALTGLTTAINVYLKARRAYIQQLDKEGNQPE